MLRPIAAYDRFAREKVFALANRYGTMMGWEGSYCGPAPLPDDLLWQWNGDPFAIGLLLLLAVWAGHSRAGRAGSLVLAFAFISPLCALSSALFAARVLHHVLLLAVAAPLLALARPAVAGASAGFPFVVSTCLLWLWHVPAAYDWALGNMAVYWVMQATLFATALSFWRGVFSNTAGAGALWVLFAYMAMGLLGALLTLAPEAMYATHAVAPLAWGMTPLADQQLGGLIMWMPAALPFAVWGSLLAGRAWRMMGDMAQ